MFNPKAMLRRLEGWFDGPGEGNPPVLTPCDSAERIQATHADAAISLRDVKGINSLDYAESLQIASTVNTHPQVLQFNRVFMRELSKHAFPLRPFEFWRAPERQSRLHATGASKARAGDSPHQYGCAVDVVHYRRFWDLSPKEWALVGALGKEAARKAKVKMIWGGDWNDNGVLVGDDPAESFWDPAHWELANWRAIRAAQNQLEADGVELDGHNKWHQLDAAARKYDSRGKAPN